MNDMKMKFTLEGIISKITILNNHDIKFAICGLEGYSIKNGNEKFNILRQANLGKDEHGQYGAGLILSPSYEFKFENVIKNTLVLANSLGRHAKLDFEISEEKQLKGLSGDDFKTPVSITLLAE